jgi:hypothetical protein
MIFCLLLNHIIFKLVHDRILCVLLIDYNVYNKTQYITYITGHYLGSSRFECMPQLADEVLLWYSNAQK